MKNARLTAWLVASAVSALLIPGCQRGNEEYPEGSSMVPGTDATGGKVVTGVARNVHADRMMVKTDQGAAYTVRLSDDTQVFKNGHRVSKAELKEGEEVRASYHTEANVIAARVDILEPAEHPREKEQVKPPPSSGQPGKEGAAFPGTNGTRYAPTDKR